MQKFGKEVNKYAETEKKGRTCFSFDGDKPRRTYLPT